MDKRRSVYFAVGLAALLLVVVLLMIRSGSRAPGSIVLPEAPADAESSGADSGRSDLNIVFIEPGTVQPAISTLSRPVSYRRTQTVETFWSGGSGQSVSQVAVSGGYTRIDTTMPDGSICHMLVNGRTAAIWYDEETEWRTLRSEQFTADIAQRMLSYETVRDLPVSSIAAADYREEDGVPCIYVTTVQDEEGYSDSYWVSVESGLLCKAERRCGEELIYRFTAAEPESAPPEESLFRLPDGSTLTSSAE